MKYHPEKALGESWITSLVGIALILVGLWAFKVHWVPTQTVYFNLMYVELSPIAIIAAGAVAILTREQHVHERAKKRPPTE